MSYFCKHCDSQIEELTGYCPTCGSDIETTGYYLDEESADEVSDGYNEYESYDSYPDRNYGSEEYGYSNTDDETYDSEYEDVDDYSDEGIDDDDDYYDDIPAPGAAFNKQDKKKKGGLSFGKNKKQKNNGRSSREYRPRQGNYAAIEDGLTLKQCLGLEFVAMVPIVSIVYYILCAIGSRAEENPSRANVARAKLIVMAVGIVLALLLSLVLGAALGGMVSALGQGSSPTLEEEIVTEEEPYEDMPYEEEPYEEEPYEEEPYEEYPYEDVPNEEESYVEVPEVEDPVIEQTTQPPEESDAPGNEIALDPAPTPTPVITGYEGLLSVLQTETHAREWRALDGTMSIAMGESVITNTPASETVVAVTLYAKNTSGTEITYGNTVFGYASQNGQMLQENTSTYADSEAYTAYTTISPGAEATIYLAFTLIDGISDVVLNIEPWTTNGGQPAVYNISLANSTTINQ